MHTIFLPCLPVGEERWPLSNESHEARGRAESFSEDVDFYEEVVALDLSNVLILWWTIYSLFAVNRGWRNINEVDTSKNDTRF